jgi:hypothetical protein
MNKNRLKMNESKTEFIMFGLRQQLEKCTSRQLCVNGTDVSQSNTIKYLGVHLDQEFNLKSHIMNKCRIASLNLHRIRSIQRNLTEDACKQLIQGLVISHLDYANALNMGLPNKDIGLLQRVQNMAAKVVLQRRYRESSSAALYELHWLPVPQRVKFKILTLVYKAIHKQAPKYLQDLVSIRVSKYTLRSTGKTLLNVPFGKTTFLDRTFSVYGPKCWNTLLQDLKNIEDFNDFKKRLRTHLKRSTRQTLVTFMFYKLHFKLIMNSILFI